jgi:hypothetical protein
MTALGISGALIERPSLTKRTHVLTDVHNGILSDHTLRLPTACLNLVGLDNRDRTRHIGIGEVPADPVICFRSKNVTRCVLQRQGCETSRLKSVGGATSCEIGDTWPQSQL